MRKLRLGFIGVGNMAGAIMSGVTGSGLFSPAEVGVCDVDAVKLKCFADKGYQTLGSTADLVASCQAFVIAVKPQSFADVLPQIKETMSPDKLIISIAAGITAEKIKEAVGFDCKIVLAMPNTPLLLGCGATALAPVPPATREDFEFAKSIFSSAGIAGEIPANLMNEVIPVNGSSPAFIYYFAKAIADFAEKSGIDAATAMALFCKTLEGSAKMLVESGKTPQQLIDMVCSPGGTTLAAMKALDDNGFSESVEAACTACVKRAEELAGQV